MQTASPHSACHLSYQILQLLECVMNHVACLPDSRTGDCIRVMPKDVLCIIQLCSWEPNWTLFHPAFHHYLVLRIVRVILCADANSTNLVRWYRIDDAFELPQILPERPVSSGIRLKLMIIFCKQKHQCKLRERSHHALRLNPCFRLISLLKASTRCCEGSLGSLIRRD